MLANDKMPVCSGSLVPCSVKDTVVGHTIELLPVLKLSLLNYGNKDCLKAGLSEFIVDVHILSEPALLSLFTRLVKI